MESTVFFAVPKNALRVFHGFRNQTLSDDAYHTALGQTFMPGTPYMLAPLGLAAYLPGVVIGDPSPDVPNEFAIIAYPSQDVWHHIMNDTLRGRVYNQTHGGIYDLKRSGASFPESLKHLPAVATDPYYSFDGATDWQVGVTRIFVGVPADTSIAGEAFRKIVRTAVENSIGYLTSIGIDQCVVMPGDGYVVIWSHASGEIGAGLPDWQSMGSNVRTVVNNGGAARTLSRGAADGGRETDESAQLYFCANARDVLEMIAVNFVVPAAAFVLAALILSITLARARREVMLRPILLTVLLPSLLTGLLAWFAFRFVTGTVSGGEPTLRHLSRASDEHTLRLPGL